MSGLSLSVLPCRRMRAVETIACAAFNCSPAVSVVAISLTTNPSRPAAFADVGPSRAVPPRHPELESTAAFALTSASICHGVVLHAIEQPRVFWPAKRSDEGTVQFDELLPALISLFFPIA